jgi:hypothetical protein
MVAAGRLSAAEARHHAHPHPASGSSSAPIGAERGHPVFTVDLELPRSTSRAIVLHLQEPAGTGTPIMLRQPLVRPLVVKLDNSRCD